MPTVTLRLNKKLSIKRTIKSYCKNTYEIIYNEKRKEKQAMKKNEVIEKRTNYNANAIKLDALLHTKAVKGSTDDKGRNGKDFESQVKSYLGNYKKAGITTIGKVDTTKTYNGKRVKIEIKQNASEIATIDKNGNIKSVLMSADYVIYAPEYSPAYAVECQAYVLDAKQFIDLLSENGLIRYKMSSAQYKKAENERWHDRITIQSLNSKARYNRMYDLLEEYGTLLKEWA